MAFTRLQAVLTKAPVLACPDARRLVTVDKGTESGRPASTARPDWSGWLWSRRFRPGAGGAGPRVGLAVDGMWSCTAIAATPARRRKDRPSTPTALFRRARGHVNPSMEAMDYFTNWPEICVGPETLPLAMMFGPPPEITGGSVMYYFRRLLDRTQVVQDYTLQAQANSVIRQHTGLEHAHLGRGQLLE
ncbi:unnamed protein product [Arctogadus glacialis]